MMLFDRYEIYLKQIMDENVWALLCHTCKILHKMILVYYFVYSLGLLGITSFVLFL